MSKTFDEGGAKGLLLANLGVSESSCHIVFDSSSIDANYDKEKETELSLNANQDEICLDVQFPRIPEGYIDASSLTDKLKSLLAEHCDDDDDWDLNNGSSSFTNIRSVPLVPQLSALRTEHEKLVDAGCCGPDAAIALASTIGPKTPAGKIRHYHANLQQEQDADYSIHQEAIERSHRKLNFNEHGLKLSSGSKLFLDSEIDDRGNVATPAFDISASDDYGGGYDDGDDDDHCFDAFIANARYSDVSLTSTSGGPGMMVTTPTEQPSLAVTTLIDAISSGTTVLSNSDYEFFSMKNSRIGNINEWAGAAHWKRSNTIKSVVSKSALPIKVSKKKPNKNPKREAKELSLVVFNPAVEPDLKHLLNPTTKRRGNVLSSTLLSKATITKYTNEENILPYDVGFNQYGSNKNSLHQLMKLFLLPNVSILQPLHLNQIDVKLGREQTVEIKKVVDFNLPTTNAWGDSNDDDDDNNGPGFDFGGNDENNSDDEYVVPVLDDVRKVDKVRVGYATVAKKVDVKRLKRDLWIELGSHFKSNTVDENLQDSEDIQDVTDIIDECATVVAPSTSTTIVSFQDTVRILGQQQAQTDATLPFYFICILHLANEKGLRLEQGNDDIENDDNGKSKGKHTTEMQQRLLSDFTIHRDETIFCDNY
jgi:condensin complex subunit 2